MLILCKLLIHSKITTTVEGQIAYKLENAFELLIWDDQKGLW